MKTWEVVTANGIELVTADRCFVGGGGALIFVRSRCVIKAYSVVGWFKTKLTTPERRLLLALLGEGK